ncbi:hypothetical protein P8452_31938 [Trifolium repens]|nr:hypothetical protein P8452_31938 [Trifolium repens]
MQEFDLRFAVPFGFYNTTLNLGISAGAVFPWGEGCMNRPSPLPERFYLGGDFSPVCTLGGPMTLWGFRTRGLGPAEPQRQSRDVFNDESNDTSRWGFCWMRLCWKTVCYNGVEDKLDTFIVYNERRRVTSSAKNKRRHGYKSLRQTPDGALLDMLRNAHDLLSPCDIKLREIGADANYVDSGVRTTISYPSSSSSWSTLGSHQPKSNITYYVIFQCLFNKKEPYCCKLVMHFHNYLNLKE